ERRRPLARHAPRRGSRDRRSAARGHPARDVRQVARVARGDVSQLSRTLRALPTLLRIGVAETVAYRGEMLVWILTTTQPLIMMGLWTAVARDSPFGGYTPAGFSAYFLATLIVRQLTGNWVAWQMSEEVRTGVMAMRLLRPIHPFFAIAASHVAAIPF